MLKTPRSPVRTRIIGLFSAFSILLSGMFACGGVINAVRQKAIDQAKDSVVDFAKKKIKQFIQKKVVKIAADNLLPYKKAEYALKVYKFVMSAGKVFEKWVENAAALNTAVGAAAQEKDYSCQEVTPDLLTAQLFAESGFDPRAVSPVGARGIAQFMPSTWQSVGVDGNGDGRVDVWDIEDAIPSAVKYDCELVRQLEKVPGDPLRNMIAAYNAGPGAVLEANGVPPFAETRSYVDTIMNTAEEFRETIQEETSSLGREIVRQAAAVVDHGYPYVWGGTSPSDGGFDCSGLVLYALDRARDKLGLPQHHILRTTQQQIGQGDEDGIHRVEWKDLQPGDVIYLWSAPPSYALPDHVVIYAGGGEILEAPKPGLMLRRMPLSSLGRFTEKDYWKDKAVRRFS